jgi:FG-GAP-like repeat
VRSIADLEAGDINGDGKLDLIATIDIRYDSGTSPGLGVYTCRGGAGSFGSKVLIPGTQGATSATPSDVNGDGKLDLIVMLSAGATTFYGDGAGNFSTTAP